jgi:hypothetical protein
LASPYPAISLVSESPFLLQQSVSERGFIVPGAAARLDGMRSLLPGRVSDRFVVFLGRGEGLDGRSTWALKAPRARAFRTFSETFSRIEAEI